MIKNEVEAERNKHKINQRYRYQLKDIFNLIDIENDGFLTLAEVKRLINL